MDTPKSQRVGQLLLGLLLLFLMVAGCVLLLRYLLGVFTGMETQRAVAIVTASATVVVSVFSIMGGRYFERKARIEAELREKKLPVYEDFMALMFRLLLGEKLGAKPSEKEMIRDLATFTQKVTLWGSDLVLQEYGRFRQVLTDLAVSPKGSQQTASSMLQFEEVVKAMRTDLGYSSGRLRSGDILRLFVTDIDKYVAPKPIRPNKRMQGTP